MVVVGDDVEVLVIVVGMVGVVITVSIVVSTVVAVVTDDDVVGTCTVVVAGVVVGTADDSVSFSAYMVNGTIIPDATSTNATSNATNKRFFLVFVRVIKSVTFFRKCVLSVILDFISISFPLIILCTLYFLIEILLINVPPFFLSISCSTSK